MAGFIFLIYLFAVGLVVIPPSIGFLLALLPPSRVLGRRVLWGYVASMLGAVGSFVAFLVVWVFLIAFSGPDRYRNNTDFVIVSTLAWGAMTFGGYVLGFILGWQFASPETPDAESAPSVQPPPLPSQGRRLSMGEKIVASAILAPLVVLLLGILVAFNLEPTVPRHQSEMVSLAEQGGMIILYIAFLWMIWRPQRSARPFAAPNRSGC